MKMTEEDIDTPEGRERILAEMRRRRKWAPVYQFFMELGFSIGRGFDRIGDGVKKAVRWFRPPPPPPEPGPEFLGPPVPPHIRDPGFYDEDGNEIPEAWLIETCSARLVVDEEPAAPASSSLP